jgi:hypothetical protein
MAIDADRLKRGWKTELPARWSLGLKGRGISETAVDVLERISSSGLPSLVNNLKSTVQTLLSDTSTAFAEDHSRVAWRDQMLKLVSESKQMALWPSGRSEAEIKSIIERLSSENIESVVQRLQKMSIPSDEEPTPVQLSQLCAVPLPRLSQLACDVKDLILFLADLDKLIKSQTKSDEDAQALAQREQLITSLEWNANVNPD